MLIFDLGVYVVLICVVGGGIWAATAPLDSGTVASGVVIYDGHKKVVHYQDGGIITKILSKEGDRVKKGDVIAIADQTKYLTDYNQSLSDYRTYLATKARLDAEYTAMSRIVNSYREDKDWIIKNNSIFLSK